MASVSDLPTGPRRRIQLGFPLGWAIDLRPNVAGALQNRMARAEKYQAWGGHFFVAICGSVEANKQPPTPSGSGGQGGSQNRPGGSCLAGGLLRLPAAESFGAKDKK